MVFSTRIQLFRLLGFKVAVDLTWFILAVLIAWSLAVGLFPELYPDLARPTYWWMGVAGTIGLFLSIVVHELSHSVVARRYGMPIKGITLFIFGGIAEMDEEPASPRAEFWTAIVGPITSFLLALLFYGLTGVAQTSGWPVTIGGVVAYLAWLNLLLAVFNMVPAFPLDGGRVLRAALWGWKGRYQWATRIASGAGSLFGLLLIALAVVSLFAGNFIGAMWWFLIGLFVRGAAQSAYQQVLIRHNLQDVPVSRLMSDDPVTVTPSIKIRELVDDFFLKHQFKGFPIVAGGRLRGFITLNDVKQVPPERWRETEISAVAQPIAPENTVTPDTDAAEALTRMMRHGSGRLLVAEGDRLIGIVSQTDLLRFLAIKLDLEGRDVSQALRRSLASTGEA